jgi:hypothetical protein
MARRITDDAQPSPQLVTVDEWRSRFSQPPAKSTIWRWIRTGKIIPQPVKFGRQYYLDKTAVYLGETV